MYKKQILRRFAPQDDKFRALFCAVQSLALDFGGYFAEVRENVTDGRGFCAALS